MNELYVATQINRAAQTLWASRPFHQRLSILRAARLRLAQRASVLVDALPSELMRTRADSMAAEVLPLLAACQFLEREASAILRTQRLGRKGLPFWLAGVHSAVERVPLGHVLVIGPANYPLFLPGVQVLQALAAGNAVTWKPGRGGAPVAEVFAAEFEQAGLPQGLLHVTPDTAAAGIEAIRAQPDKIFFTGSTTAGRAVMHLAADSATPVVAELSGCDAIIVLPGADHGRLAAALEFGMRLNGSATCMAPRRLMLVGSGHGALIARLRERFAAMPGIVVSDSVRDQLRALIEDASTAGATVCGDMRAVWLKPLLVLDAHPSMPIAQADIFAPVLSVLECPDVEAMLLADAQCPFGLTAAIFGPEQQALAVGARMRVGTVLINDLIVPTADPRIPFGGRRASGFGVTRGREGLLEMTAAKTILVRRSKSTRHYAETTHLHEQMFTGVAEMSHSQTWRDRISGFRTVIAAARKMGRQ